jgi:hypothetical protein
VGLTRAGAGGESTGRGADLLGSAAALRWARPDLTGAIADHVLETAGIAGDRECWLSAAAWAVHARSATGDGRETASDVMAQLSRWERAPLDHRAARRLRIELAQVAAAAGEVETARGLLGPVLVDETEPELRADLLSAIARCAVEDAPECVADALRAASEAWTAVPGPDGEVGAASVALISAVVDRRNRRPDAAVDHAAEGLTRLERGRGAGSAGTPSGHLAAALAAEWISALLDAGRADEARDGCVPLMPRLAEPARPSRQLALLRLTVARAVATGGGAGSSVGLLEQAAEDAAASDAPDLESVCRTALGALQEKTGPLETALETLRLGVAAERRDRARIARFRTALTELPPSALRPAATDAGLPGTAGRTRAEASGGSETAPRSRAGSASEVSSTASSTPSTDTAGSAYDWDAFLRAAETDRPADSAGRGGRRRRDERETGQRESAREQSYDTSRRHDAEQRRGNDLPSRRGGEPEPREPSWLSADRRDDVEVSRPRSGDSGVPWEEAGDSPISDLLFRSLRPSSDDRRNEPDDTPEPGRRNGTNGHRAGESAGRRGSGSSEPTRNGHGRSLPDETAGGSHRRPARDENTTSERGRDGSSWAAAASSWLSEAGRFASEREADDESWSRRRAERSRDEDVWPLADAGGRAEESGSRRSRSDSGAPSRDADQGTSGGGRRHRAESPWSTGQWPGARRDADDALERDRADRSGESTELLPPARSSNASQDPEAWLRAAIADLDRVWGPAGPGAGGESAGSTDRPSQRARSDAADEQCTVVIDVARDGRRFAGRRAGAVVRAVADLLTDRLPRGARLRLGESDALSISMPGWDRGAATEWLHRTLPGLLAGFDAGEDLPSAQLRAAVHDADGPVGAQILQSLEQPSGRRDDSGIDREPEQPASFGGRARQDDLPSGTRAGRRRAEDREPQERERASDRDVERRDAGGADDRRHGAGNGSAGGADAGGRRHRRATDVEARRTEAADRKPERAAGEHDQEATRNSERRDEAGSSGTTAKDTTTAEPASPPTPEATEGLGIADLLAGALAAYRAI